MRKVVSIMAVAALLFSINVNAQEPKAKKKTPKTEKAVASAKEEKKACATDSGKKSCCAHK